MPASTNPFFAFVAAHTKTDGETQQEFVKRMAEMYRQGGSQAVKAPSAKKPAQSALVAKQATQRAFLQEMM